MGKTLIYKNLEIVYKKNDIFQKLFRLYIFGATLSFLVYCTLIFIFKFNNIISSVVIFVILLFLLFFRLHIILKKHLEPKDKKKDFKTKLITTVQREYKQRKIILINTLKSENIRTKKDIEIIMNYYNNLIPKSERKSLLNILTSISITIASFVVIVINESTGKINFNLLETVIGQVLTFIIIFGSPIIIYNIYRTVATNNKIEIYKELHETITDLYFNYEEYKRVS